MTAIREVPALKDVSSIQTVFRNLSQPVCFDLILSARTPFGMRSLIVNARPALVAICLFSLTMTMQSPYRDI